MTTDVVEELHGLTVLVCAPDGPVLRDDRDAVDLIGEALGRGVELVLLPVPRLADEFFTLSTGIAGAIIQKFVNYRLRLAVIGDISAHLARSAALRDLVRETNRGRQLWLLPTREELEQRLARTAVAN
jgi:hypothetical protein